MVDITLNGELLDFTLEREKNLGDVITGMEKWLCEGQMVMTSLLLDGTEIDQQQRAQWGDRLLTTCHTLAISALSLQEVRTGSIQTAGEFLGLMNEALCLNDQTLLQQLKPGYPYMLQSLHHLVNLLPAVAIIKKVENFLQTYATLEWDDFCALRGAAREQVSLMLKELQGDLEQLILSESEPLETLKQLACHLESLVSELGNVSILLQTGQDKAAMDLIIRFTGQLQKLQDLLIMLKTGRGWVLRQQQIAGQDIESFYNALNGIFKELIEAFNVNDLVLIGDLLEYEIAPRLGELIAFIRNLEQILEKNVR